MSFFKPFLKADPNQKVFRARPDVATVDCANCGKKVFKQDEKHIVFFCSKSCRKELRSGKKSKEKSKFRVVEANTQASMPKEA